MKHLKKTVKIIWAIVLTVIMAAVFSACGSDGASDTYLVYYSNLEADNIEYREYKMSNPSAKNVYDKVSELLNQMFNGSADETLISVKPQGVDVNDIIVSEEGILKIDFTDSYNNLTNVREILLRSAVCLTVMQVEGVTGVEFTVEDNPITDHIGNPIGVMTADSFVNVLLTDEGMLKQEEKLNIFFASIDDHSRLTPVAYTFTMVNSNLSLEEYIVQHIIEGPEEGKAYATISPEVKLLSIVTTEGICYVNFDSNFLDQNLQPVSDEVMVYSIVNSLCELSYVDSVQFMVEGDSDVILHMVTDLTKPLTGNKEIEVYN